MDQGRCFSTTSDWIMCRTKGVFSAPWIILRYKY